MKDSIKVLLLFLSLAIPLTILTAGCDGDHEAADDKILKLGVLGPYSGDSIDVGTEFKGAVEMAFDQVDHKIGDYEVEFIWIDSQSDPKKATLAYEEAANENDIDACILNWHSSVAVAVMDAAARNQVPHFFGFGGTEVINEKYEHNPEYYSYWMGKTWPAPKKLTGTYIEAIEKAIEDELWHPCNKRIAIYGEDTDWGKSFGNALASEFKKAGWEVTGKEFFPTGATELSTVIDRLQEMDPTVIAGSMATAPSLGAFLNKTREVDLQSVVIADGLGWIGEWYEITGPASNYVLDQGQAWTTTEAIEFKKEFKERHGFTPSTSSGGMAYDMASFFIQLAESTLEEHGVLDRDSLYRHGQDKLWTGEITYSDGLIMEEYKYTPETVPDLLVGENYFTFPVVQYYGGEEKIIWPEAWKETEFTPPDYLED